MGMVGVAPAFLPLSLGVGVASGAAVAAAGAGSCAAALAPERVSGEEARGTLDGFEVLVREKSSHAGVVDFDLSGAVAAAKGRIGEEISLNELIMMMQVLLAPIGDGHSGVSTDGREALSAQRGISDGGRVACLPLRLEMIGENAGDPIIGVLVDRSGFVDADHPVVESIDGVAIERWIDAVMPIVPRGTAGFMRNRALWELRDLWRWREVLGIEDGRDVVLGLASLDGERRTSVTMRTQSGRYGRLSLPQSESRMMEGNIGYLRIETMRRGPDELEDLREWMDTFRETDGLIIDVRGNGGGQRHVLPMLAGYLMDPAEGPRVYTAVRPRMVDGGDELSDRMRRRMADRRLYPEDHEIWTEAQRSAIARFREEFRPEGPIAEELFAEWHYAMVIPVSDERTYHYSAPVIVLMDVHCFSATDVFLQAMSILPNVQLMGQASAGSSGAPEWHDLPIEGVRVRLSTIVGWRSDGSRFDGGKGQEPDVVVERTAGYFVGEEDVVLEEAVRGVRR